MESYTRIEMFNGLRVKQRDNVYESFETQQTKGVIAYLAYNMPRKVSRDVICDEFWPEATSAKGRNSLSQALGCLRRIVEPIGVERGAVVVAPRNEVWLNANAVTTDVGDFRRKLELARRAEGDDLVRRQHLEDAVALYSGPFLRGSYFYWAEQAERYLAELFIGAVRDLVALLERAGEYPRAVEAAERAVRQDNLREDLHCELMRLHLRMNQPGKANACYRELVRILKEEELGEIGEESRALARQIQAALKAASAEEPAPRPSAASRRAPSRPASGTVTFLMTTIDTDGHTSPDEPRDRLHRLLTRVAGRHGGRVSAPIGAAAALSFAGAGDALAAALALRRELEESPRNATLRLARMAVDIGDVRFVEGRYEGATVDRAGRLLAAANPGQLICSQSCADIARGDGDSPIRFTSLGAFTFGGPQSVRIVQADDAAGPARTFPPLRAASAHGARIPLSSTRFFGRTAELADLRARLLDRRQRLVTITGPGGNGKTRLVKEAASDLIADYRGAVWFVGLDYAGDQDMMVDAIRDALRLPTDPHTRPVDQIVSALSEQPSLLILDNFEQLVQGDSPLIVSTLLERVPDLQCLVTSRLLLNLVGEHEMALSPLPTPNGASAPETLALVESVQLFIDRARQRDPDFQVTNHNAAAVAGICDHLDGIPLAIELAAALRLPPREILARMQNRFEFLISRSRDRTTRHRTMLACIDIGFDLLDPELQRFFTRLCAFRGSWSDTAAEEILGEPQALDYLTELREASLLISDNTEDEIRFRMLETLREYALLKISPEDKEEVVQRHARYYLDLAEAALPEYDRADQGAWYARMSREHHNLRAATDWARDGARHDLYVRFVLARFPLLQRDGFWDEAQRELESALIAAEYVPNNGPSVLRAALQYGLGCLVHERGDFSLADRLLLESLQTRRELGVRSAIADCLNKLGANAIQAGSIDAAAGYLGEIPGFLEADDHLRHARMNTNLGILFGRRNEPGRKQQLMEQALAQFQLAGDRHGQAITMINLGCMAINAAEWQSAESYSRQAVILLHTIGEVSKLPLALNNLGYTSVMQHDHATGAVLIYHASLIGQRLGSRDTQLVRDSLRELAEIVGPEQYVALEARAKETSWEALLGLKKYVDI